MGNILNYGVYHPELGKGQDMLILVRAILRYFQVSGLVVFNNEF